MSKRALITGVSGQDGAYLSKLLLENDYEVFGGHRQNASSEFWRLAELGILDRVKLVPLELLEASNIVRVLDKIRPHEIYNLGAQSFVGASFEQPLYTSDVNGLGALRLLEAIRSVDTSIRFYQASTSEMFGQVQSPRQAEDTPFYPRSPYGVAKVFAHWATVNYREAYGLHASCGILFNHESPLRGREFVTRKITRALAEIRLGRREVLALGNLKARRDWGFSGDYVDAIWRMLQQPSGDDFVVATGATHSVEEFVERAAAQLGYQIAWAGTGVDQVGIDTATGRTIVKVDPAFFRPAEVDTLTGDARKASECLGWAPTTTFDTLVAMMADADLERAGRGTLHG
jgi:GDPmannose 4,6-dehydratase